MQACQAEELTRKSPRRTMYFTNEELAFVSAENGQRVPRLFVTTAQPHVMKIVGKCGNPLRAVVRKKVKEKKNP